MTGSKHAPCSGGAATKTAIAVLAAVVAATRWLASMSTTSTATPETTRPTTSSRSANAAISAASTTGQSRKSISHRLARLASVPRRLATSLQTRDMDPLLPVDVKAYETDGAVVFYDPENPPAWIQSDYILEIAR